ncbi:MAG: FGGY family carbohydrate kinase [bacterium]
MADDIVYTVDAGSSGLRVSAYSPDGSQLWQDRRPFRLTLSEGNKAELDPELVWNALIDLFRDRPDLPGQPVGLGVSAALSVVIADKNGRPLRPAMMWQDRRAGAESDEIERLAGNPSLLSGAGRPSDPELLAPKLMWLRRHEPDLFQSADVAYTLKDWILQQMTGARVTDRTSASYSLLYDVATDQWNDALSSTLDLPKYLLPPVYPANSRAGSLQRNVAEELRLPAGLPVIVGGPDGSMGAIGSGLASPGTLVDIIGTTDVVFALTDSPLPEPGGRVLLNAFVIPGLWAIGGPLGLTGGALSWFLEEFLANGEGNNFSRIDELAENVPAGADGLLFFPALAGERAPRWNTEARGVLFGLSTNHGLQTIARALLEGTAFMVADMVDAVASVGVPFERVVAAGGGANSALWLAIRAAALNRRLDVPRILEATSLGTAIAVMVGVGIHRSFQEAVDSTVCIAHTVSPDPAAVKVYSETRHHFKFLYEQSLPLFSALGTTNTTDRQE